MEEGLRPPTAPRDDSSVTVLKASRNPNLKLWGSMGLVLVILLLVVLLLPSMVPDPASGQQAAVPGADHKTAVEKPSQLPVPDHFRTDAEQALQNFLRIQAQPDLDNAEIWANDAWQKAFNTAAHGDDVFGQGDFITALDSYKDAGAQLQTILNDRDHILQQSLEAGWQFLDENAVEEASAAFGRVIAMQSDHQQAGLGIERSAVREQVLELFITAQQAEISNTLPLAADAYTSALQLDPLYIPARQALDKVETELRNRAFGDSLGRALQGIENGQFAMAEKALSEATKIRPDDVAIKDARQRLLAARRQARLSALRTEAGHLEQTENWAAARDRYVQALKVDPQAAFARNGRTKTEQKLQLHKQLDHYLTDITRLYSEDPLNNARELLAAHQLTSGNEPLLSEKLEKLQEAVRLAVIPIDLLLISDNLTQVTVYKIGQLGTFAQKQLSLRPGKYTVTGSRRGYRDVLKQVDLRPGTNGQSLDIRAEEQI
jgi:hypothetical protein